jgi:DNA polymerase III alpha subunit
MNQDKYGQIVLNEDDLINLVLEGKSIPSNILADFKIDLTSAALILDNIPTFIEYNEVATESVEEFDHRCQSNWYMPDEYKNLDIAAHILNLCNSQAQLQRCGEELLLYQERNLFDLLRYLVFLVDTLREHNFIWGVGRGSSVSSYVLYLLGIHKIDSLFYDLDPKDFLR